MATATQDDVVTELTTWLEENWDPDLTVGEWWERLGLAGWAAPNLPANAYGRDLSRNDTVRVQEEIARFGALGAPGGLGLMLAAPTIATHGSQEQIDRYVRDIVDARRNVLGLFMPAALGLIFVMLGMPSLTVQRLMSPAMLVLMLIMAADGILLARRVNKAVDAKFPDNGESHWKLGIYAAGRASQIRRMRAPRPQVERGAKVV